MRKAAIAAAICVGCTFVWLAVAHGQFGGGGPWAQVGGNAQLTGWQQSEPRITLANASDIKKQWDLKLKASTEGLPVPTEPLFIGRVIMEKGFKDMALVLGPGNNIYDVDYELGQMVWQKHFDIQQSAAQVGACPDGQFAVVTIQPPPNFARLFALRGRGRGPGRGRAPFPRPPAPTPLSQRRVGGTASGGSPFGLRGIYVLTSDGDLHELLVSNGEDYGFPVRVIPFRNGNVSALTMNGSSIYFNTSDHCGGSMKVGGIWDPEPNGTWSVNMGTPDYKTALYNTHDISATGLDGPAQSTDGKTLYVTTSGGATGTVTGGVYPNSVVALDAATMQVEDYYEPSGKEASAKTDINVSPVVFTYEGRDLIAAYGAGGRLVLLDSKSLGGADHHTPLAITAPIAADGGNGSWGRLATAELNNARWIFVSVQGPRLSDVSFPTTHGATPNGSIVAFEVQDQGGKPVLTPEWVSPDMVNPSPAAIASGVVFSLANGKEGSSNAKLFALNATTGAMLCTSGNEITSPGYFSSVSVSLGHVLFVTEDDTLYSYGISILHSPRTPANKS
jgi:hypothetical protein